jgi:hypothetical protein
MINNHYVSLERWSVGKVGISRQKMNTPKAYDAHSTTFLNYSSIIIKISRFAGNFILSENIKKKLRGT